MAFFEKEKSRICISGASGFVGSHLSRFLQSQNHDIYHLVRKEPQNEKEIFWDAKEKIDTDAMENFDTIIHLSGENISALRWTKEKKQRILQSRIKSTRLLATSLENLKNPPKTFLCASAIGYFGNSGEEIVTEKSPKGAGFLADVCEKWEQETHLFTKGRVVNTRFGTILSPDGGMLKKILPLFSLALGGVIGSGKQYISWITIDDLLYGLYHIMNTPNIKGPALLVTPHPVTNREFTKTLGKVLKRPTLFPLPVPIVRFLFSQMGEEMLLTSIRAHPQKLIESNMPFAFPTLEEALNYLLKGE